MTYVTCRLTAKNRDQLRNLCSAIEYGLPLPFKVLTYIAASGAHVVAYVDVSNDRSLGHVDDELCEAGQRRVDFDLEHGQHVSVDRLADDVLGSVHCLVLAGCQKVHRNLECRRHRKIQRYAYHIAGY